MSQNYRFRGLTPYLYYENAAAALSWLSRSFGFKERVRYLDAAGVVREAEMVAGDVIIHIAGADPGYWKEQGAKGPVGQLNIIYVANVDAHHRAASSAGVKCDPPQDRPYGARVYDVQDPEGHWWTFWQHLTDHVELDEGWKEIRAKDV
jgi:uncharacterized glyoxalase superfamily protein PhnB